jgi:hypothetical protein
MAEALIARNEIKFIWNQQEYRVKMANNLPRRIADSENIAQASGFTELLRSAVRTLGPITGSYLTGMGMPMVGSLVNTLSANAGGAYRLPIAGSSGQASTPQSFSTRSGVVATVPSRGRARAYTDEDLVPELANLQVNMVQYEPDNTIEDYDQKLAQLESIIGTLNPQYEGIGAEKNLKQEAFLRGQVSSMAKVASTNKFPIVLTDGRVQIAYAMHTPEPLFPGTIYTFGAPLSDTVNIHCNTTLANDAAIAVALARAASGYMGGQMLLLVPDPAEINELAGMSMGLAALLSYLGTESFSALTGSVDAGGVIYAPGMLTEKAKACREMGISMITPYDDIMAAELVSNLSTSGEDRFVSLPATNQYLDFTESGFWPKVVLAANVTVVRFAAQTSRMWTLNAGKSTNLGQKVPTINMDLVSKYTMEGDQVKEDQILAPNKFDPNLIKVGSTFITQTDYNRVLSFFANPQNVALVTPFVNLKRFFVNRTWNFPNALLTALKSKNAVAVQSGLQFINAYDNWSARPDKTGDITHSQAAAILRATHPSKLAGVLNIKQKPADYQGTLDDYIKDVVEAKITAHEASGIAHTLKQTPKAKFTYKTIGSTPVRGKEAGAKVSLLRQPAAPVKAPIIHKVVPVVPKQPPEPTFTREDKPLNLEDVEQYVDQILAADEGQDEGPQYDPTLEENYEANLAQDYEGPPPGLEVQPPAQPQVVPTTTADPFAAIMAAINGVNTNVTQIKGEVAAIGERVSQLETKKNTPPAFTRRRNN